MVLGGVELLLIGISAVLLFISLWKSGSKPPNFPDGPRGVPIFGNLFQVGSEPHKAFMEMGKKWGDIFSIKMGSYDAVVFNNYKDIRDILSLSSSSGRPTFPERLDRCGGSPSGLIFNVGHSWTEQRRFALKTLRDFGFGKQSMEAMVIEEAQELIDSFKKTLGKPIVTQNRFNAAVLNALWQMITGQRYSHDDPILQSLIERITTTVTQGTAMALYMFIPWIYKLRCKLPGSYLKVRQETQNRNLEFIRKSIKEHKETFQDDAPPRDFIDMYLAEMKRNKNDPTSSFSEKTATKNMEISILDLFVAGSETTSTTLSWMFLLLALHPEKQDKLFEEIKRVVGLSRLPQLSDRPSMPYTEAVINETMRFSLIVPLAALHSANEDIRFKNYVIPKGTVIIPNLYSASRDPHFWKDPEEFIPERFLSPDEKSVKKAEALMPFSIGKRICLGMTLAESELFLFSTCLFQAFRVQEDPNSDEKLKVDYYKAGIRLPKPQNMVLVERK